MKILVVTAMVPLCQFHLCGATIIDTFGPGNSFNPNGILFSGWSTQNQFGKGVAAAFTVTGGDYRLSSITLALGYVQDTSLTAISVVQDNAGTPTGAMLEQPTPNLSAVSNALQVVTFNSSLNPIMANGSKFWLMLEPAAPNPLNNVGNTAYEWYISGSVGSIALRDFDFQSSTWFPWDVANLALLPAFRIEGTLVPEPTALWLILGGLAVLGVQRDRRRNSSHR